MIPFGRYGDTILLGSEGQKVPFVFFFEELWAGFLQHDSTGCVTVLSQKGPGLGARTV